MYGGGGIPQVRFDGSLLQSGASSCNGAANNYRNLIQQRLTATNSLSPLKIEGTFEVVGDDVMVTTTATLVDPVMLSDLRFTVLVLEDDVLETGNTFNHVTRAAFDQDITLASQDDFVTVEPSFSNPGDWDMDNVSVIAFVQRMSGDYEIHQTAVLLDGSSSVDEIPAPVANVLRIDQVFPNPLQAKGGAELVVRFALPSNQDVNDASLSLIDLSGRVVRRLHQGGIYSPELALSWDGRDDNGAPLQSGAYWLRVNSPAGADNIKMFMIR